jgi:hypothetical protein
MPLELGVFLGAKRFGDAVQKGKRCLILDREPYRYHRFISDIAGQDIKSHRNQVVTCIGVVSEWLRSQSRRKTIPGGKRIAGDFVKFRDLELPRLCAKYGLEIDELTFSDYSVMASEYVASSA